MTKITKVTLHLYSRLFLNNISTLVYTPESNIQLILGTNGSGKSSLLDMMTFLPADIKNKFKEGGYVEVEGVHNGNEYKVNSGVKGPSKHSFYFNGEDLNTGGTKKAQLALIKEHLNIEPKANQVISGRKRFTGMDTNDRKFWLREMSTVDYSYAINVFMQLKSRLRDLQGGVKLINNEITKDISLITNEEELIKAKMDLKQLKSLMDELRFNYSHVDVEDNTSTLNRIAKVVAILENKKEHISKVNDVDEIKMKIQHLNIRKVTIEKDLDACLKELDKLEFIENNSINVEELENDLKEYMKMEKNVVPILNKYNVDKSLVKVILNALELSYVSCIGIVDELSEFDHIIINNETHKTLKESLESVSEKYLSDLNRLNSYKEQNEHYNKLKNSDNEISCDSCGHKQYIGYDIKRHEAVIDNIKTLTKSVDKLKPNKESLEKEFGLVNQKIQLISALKNIFIDNDLDIVWRYIVKDTMIGEIKSIELMSKIERYVSDLKSIKNVENLYKLIDDTENKLHINKEVNKAKKNLMFESKDMLDKKLEELTESKKNLNKEIQIAELLVKEINSIVGHIEELKILLTKSKIDKNNEIKQSKNNHIKELIAELSEPILSLEDLISNNDKYKNRIETNKKLVEDYNSKIEVVNNMIKALSPNEGLIAKSINSFINKMLLEVNVIINEIWSYDMKLLPCEIEEEDLDYKFRVRVDSRETIDDISSLSTGMKDIVDLAFKIVFMKYTKNNHLPLILDEFGSGMDHTHRDVSYRTINNIMSSSFNQIFITSHYKSVYGIFDTADINILDSSNLMLDTNTIYNEKLIIT